MKVSCSVTNTGEHAGKETVQIYVAPEQKKDRPVHELKAFEKVGLDAGETKRICVILEERDFPIMTQTKDAGSGKWNV